MQVADLDIGDWDTKQSRVSHILSEKITIHLIIIVLLMLFGCQGLVASHYEPIPDYQQLGLEVSLRIGCWRHPCQIISRRFS
jgi:hypothetical protein